VPLDVSKSVSIGEPKELKVVLEKYNETVILTYDFSRYNAAMEHMLVERATQLPAGAVESMILTLVTEWDITSNGIPVPISKEGLVLCDFFTIQIPIANAIMDDLSESKPQPSDSQKSSSTVKKP
jgi:hypothetical protein